MTPRPRRMPSFARMPAHQRPPLLRRLLVVLPFVALALAGPARAGADPESALRGAWQKARQVGAYSFSSTVTQTTFPAPLLGNAGRHPDVKTLTLEGEVDQAADRLRLWLWEGPPETFDRGAALELQVADGQTQARRPGSAWQDVGPVSPLFAPGYDAAAFLAVARGSRWVEQTTRSIPGRRAAVFDRYQFEVDDQAMTRRLRKDLEAELKRRGKLPAGLQPAMAGLFVDSIGRGQAWVDAEGLPARLQLDFEWPEDSAGRRRSATVRTDFKDYDRSQLPPAFAAAPAAWLVGTAKAAWRFGDWDGLARQLSLLAAAALALGLAWQLRRRDRSGRLAIVLTLAILLAPVADIAQAREAEQSRLAAQLAGLAAAAEGSRADDALSMIEADGAEDASSVPEGRGEVGATSAAEGSGSPDQPAELPEVPTAADAVTADSAGGDQDQDGLSDAEESELCRDLPADAAICPDGGKADTDGDGLTDGQEYKHLGTDVNRADSDGDGLSDGLEVRGFSGGSSDPLASDSDQDGRSDGEECPALAATRSCPDSDGDSRPDLADDDSDGDGFFDSIDESPLSQSGPLSDAQPLVLAVKNLEPGRAVFVDFQVAPTHRDRLGRVASVLDWPTGDSAGQIQRRVDDSFADVQAAAGAEASPSDSYGDLRLLPMLEVTMDGAGAALPRRTAELGFPVVSHQQMAVVQLIDDEKQGQTVAYVQALDRAPGRSYGMRLVKGSCRAQGELVKDFGTLISGASVRLAGRLSAYAGSHALIVSAAAGDGATVCRPVEGLLKDTIALSLSFDRKAQLLGQATMKQEAGGVSLAFDPAGGGSHDAALIQGDCAERGQGLLTLSGLAAGRPALLAGRNLVDLADQTHALVLSQGGREVACVTLPNLVNGPASERLQVDEAALLPYGISVQELGPDGRLVARLPLTMVSEAGSGRAAGLGGRMRFDLGQRTAIQAEVRLVWLVQALTDLCTDPPGDFMAGLPEAARIETWCAQEGQVNQAQIVHRYTDDWRLAGLTVREDRGLELATLYEEPTVAAPNGGPPAGLNPELLMLASSLERRFVSGLDCDLRSKASVCTPDGRRDITVAQLPALYDRDLPQPPGQARLGLRDIQVLRDSAATHDRLQPLIHARVPELLDRTFAAAGAPDPLLLFAREESFRSLSYGAPEGGGGGGGSQATLDFASPGRPPVQPMVVAAIHWMPYRRDKATLAWEPYPFQEYWNALSEPLKANFPAGSGEEAALEAAGRVGLTQLLYTHLYLGQARVVEAEGRLTWATGQSVVVSGYSDEELAQQARAARDDASVIINGGLTRLVIEPIGNELGLKMDEFIRVDAPKLRLVNVKPAPQYQEFFSQLGAVLKEQKANALAAFARNKGNKRWLAAKGAMGGAVMLGIAGGIGSFVNTQTKGPPAAGQIFAAMTAAYAIADTANTTYKFFQAAKKTGNAGGVAALILSEAVAWGILFYRIGAAGITFASLQMNAIVADAAGGSVVALALFMLAAAHPVGAIISAVIGLIDALIALSCSFLSKDQRSSTAGEVVCKGLTGWMAKGVAYVIYSQTDMVTINDPYRTTVLDLTTALKDPAAGLVPKKAMDLRLGLRNTLGLIAVPPNLGALYWHQYTPEALRSSAFKYQVVAAKETVEDKELHNTLSWDTQAADWLAFNPADPADKRVVMELKQVEGTVTTPAETGLNRGLAAYLAEAYAIPVQECVLIPIVPLVIPVPIPVCWKRERKDTRYIDLNLQFDLFPPALDDFLALTPAGPAGPWAPSWGQTGNLKLPPLKDADGDGLPFAADPADDRWDSDGDGIADPVELSRKTDPNAPDTDGDGLPDPEELRRGTDPARPDTDADGATDAEEVTGWRVVYGFVPGESDRLETRVSSNPLEPDGDGDGILDGRERDFGFSPSAKSDATALAYETALREPTAPVLYLPLDEAAGADRFAEKARAGTAGCRAVDGPAGAAHCPAAGHQGRFGNAAFFDGAGDHLTILRPKAVTELARNYTVALWLKPLRLDRDQTLLSMAGTGGGFAITLENRRVVLTLSDGYRTWGDADGLVPEAWNHLIVEMADPNPADPAFYTYVTVNGRIVLEGRIEGQHAARPGTGGDLVIGAALQPTMDPQVTTVTRPFQGLIDELVIQDWSDLASGANVKTLSEGGINLEDGAARPGQRLLYEGRLENLLLSRTAYGMQQVSYPPGLTTQADERRPFQLPPRSSERYVHRRQSAFVVADTAATGSYRLQQSVGAAIVAPPDALWKPADSTQVFRWPGQQVFDGRSAIRSANPAPLRLDDKSFTLAAWIDAQPPEGDTVRRGIMGFDSGAAKGYPYLQVQGRALIFGYSTETGSGAAAKSVIVEARSTDSLRTYGPNHVAVTYDRASGLATFYLNGVRDVARTMSPAPKHDAFPDFFIGRSTDKARLTVEELKLTCEGDGSGDGEYNLLSDDSRPPVHLEYSGSADDDAPKVLATDLVFNVVGAATLALCEDDDGLRMGCDAGRGDDLIGSLTVGSHEPSRTATVTWSSRPGKPDCSPEWLFDYPDTASVRYRLETGAAPFIGSLSDLRIFASALSDAQVAQLVGSAETLADLRFDEIPGQRSFLDAAGFLRGLCPAARDACPQSGVPGRRNLGLSFDGRDDYLAVDGLSSRVAEDRQFAVSAWLLPADGLTGWGTVWSFHDAAGTNKLMLQAHKEADGSFTLATYDDAAGRRTLFSGLPRDTWLHLALSVAGDDRLTAHLGYQAADGRDVNQVSTPIAIQRPVAFPVAGGRFSLGQEWDGAGSSDFFQGDIDEVRVLRKALDEVEVRLLYLDPPVARLAFDGPPKGVRVLSDLQVQAGLEGQVGLAGGFDGQASRLTLRPPAGRGFSFAAWLRADELGAGGDPAVRPIFHGRGADLGGVVFGKNGDYAFYLENGVPTLSSCSGDGARFNKRYAQGLTIPPNVWTHVLVSGENLFVNGAPAVMAGSARLDIGNLEAVDIGASFLPKAATPCAAGPRSYQHFAGRIDEVEIYDHALSGEEISSQFNLQNGWVDETRTDPLLVDSDPPIADLELAETYLPASPTMLLATAADVGTRVARLELGVDGGGWLGAAEARDSGAEPGTAWMPLFSPPGGGEHRLQVRAIDAVGNRSQPSAPRTVYVDEQPPAISVAIEADLSRPIRLLPKPGADATWVLTVKGTVSDPYILGTQVPGSGVAGLTVTLVDARTGEPLPIAPQQVAEVTVPSFELDYLLYTDDPSGQYIVRAEAVDRVGNRRSYDSPELVTVDNRAPASQTTAMRVPSQPLAALAGRMGPAPLGPAQDPPPPLLASLLDAGSLIEGQVSDQPAVVGQPEGVGVQGVELAFRPAVPQAAPFDLGGLPENLLLYLPLDEEQGGRPEPRFLDLVAGHAAHCSGAACGRSGLAARNAQALGFDGVDDSLVIDTLPTLGSLTGDLTVAAWIKPEDLSGIGRILSTPHGDQPVGLGFGHYGSRLTLTLWGIKDYDSGEGVLRPGVWQHVAVHLTADHDAEFYVNGRLVDRVAGKAPAGIGADGPLLVGAAALSGDAALRESFRGAIDELVVARGRIADADWPRVFGQGPTLHLGFDDPWVAPGRPLFDGGGMGAVADYLSSVGDPDDGTHRTVGVVGAGAMQFTPTSRGLAVEAPPGVLPRDGASFSLTLWLRDMAEGRLIYGGNEITFAPGGILHRFGGALAAIPVDDGSGWHHLAFVWDAAAGRLSTFIDGRQVQQEAVDLGPPLDLPQTSLLIQHESVAGRPALDDLRVYQRPLPALELSAMARERWWPAADFDSGRGAWFGRVPEALEGFYDLLSRGRDRLGNVDEEPKAVWSGYVDSLAPRRPAYESRPEGNGIRHLLTVEDFGLDLGPGKLTLPAACKAADTRITRRLVGAPWYLSLLDRLGAGQGAEADGARQRVWRAEIDCRASWARSGDRFEVCDLAANCLAWTYEGPDIGSPPPPTATATAGPSPTPTATLPPPTSTTRPATATRTPPPTATAGPSPTRAPTRTATRPGPTRTRTPGPSPTVDPAGGGARPVFLPRLQLGEVEGGGP